MTADLWPTHRRRRLERGARTRWAKRKRSLERKGQALKPRTPRPDRKPAELDASIWDRL